MKTEKRGFLKCFIVRCLRENSFFMERVAQKSMNYHIPLISDCKFGNRLPPGLILQCLMSQPRRVA